MLRLTGLVLGAVVLIGLGACQSAFDLIPSDITETVATETGERIQDYCANVGNDLEFRMKLLDLVNAGDSPTDAHMLPVDCDGDWVPDFEANPANR